MVPQVVVVGPLEVVQVTVDRGNGSVGSGTCVCDFGVSGSQGSGTSDRSWWQRDRRQWYSSPRFRAMTASRVVPLTVSRALNAQFVHFRNFKVSKTLTQKYFMGTYPCVWVFRFDSLRVRKVARTYSFAPILAHFWRCGFWWFPDFVNPLFCGSFWIPFWAFCLF
jgi:hypothetical protein